MKIGLLEAGQIPDELVPVHGDYPTMFHRLLTQALPNAELHRVAVLDGEIPERPDMCAAWIVTGSRHGVYDPLPWIDPLKAFLRDVRTAHVPSIGVCFGHQIMAEAFGGRAEKSVRGWGLGVQDYALLRRPGWLPTTAETFSLHAMHQDQVTALPEDATVLAESAHCPYAMLSYGDPEAPDAISIQPHPEFDAGIMGALMGLPSRSYPEERRAPALESLGRPVINRDVAHWMASYLDQRLAKRPAA